MATFLFVLKNQKGFTLIEALVVLSVLSVLGLLAAPALQDFFIRQKFKNISEEFIASIFKAKNTAVSKNICTTMCMSSNADAASPSCATSGNDWQPGWIVFLNTECNSSLNKPENLEDILYLHVGKENDYFLKSQKSTPTRKLQFNAKGMSTLNNADEFDLMFKEPGHAYTEKFGINICLDALGRTRTVPSEATCKNYK